MRDDDTWYIEERAIAYAGVLLTRQPELAARPVADLVYHIQAELLRKKKPTGRLFGVQVLGEREMPSPEPAERRILVPIQEPTQPMCAFAIGAINLEGFYRWIFKPSLAEGQAILVREDENAWQPLDDAAVVRLIAEVNAWYDALDNASPPQRKRQGEPAIPR